ncbi:class I SAM-dependent methyltransferase [Actinopolymorpha singaporensis]
MASIPERVRWAVDVLDPGPAAHVLEIGCGAGAAAELVCARLRSGRLVALDRSAVAVRRTLDRNAGHVSAGRLEVRHGELDTLDLPDHSLDVAFSVDVNLFWTRCPTAELHLLTAALRPGGALWVLYGAGGPRTGARLTDPIVAALGEHGFTEVTVLDEPRGLGVRARTPVGSPSSPPAKARN